MIEQNRSEFEKSNILKWQADNQGEKTTIVVLDEGFIPFPHMAHQVEVMDFGYSGTKERTTGHGSAVMSIGFEISPKAKIIYMPFNSVSAEQKHKMIDWIIGHKDEIDVITMSLTFAAIVGAKYFERLRDIQVPFFVASGNEGYDSKIGYPANEAFTIAVGAYHDGSNGIASYSNGSKELDCVAFSGTHMYNSRGEVMSQVGTSFATPFASFATLLYISWRKRNGLPKLMLEECRKWIKQNALDIKEPGFDYPSGWGLFRLPDEIPDTEESDDMRFKDMENHWAKDYVEFVSEKGLMKGYEEGAPGPEDDTFRPDAPMTRAEVATVIARMLGFVKK